MKSHPQQKPASHDSPRGFALVVSLAMLVLLTLIAVGLLSLSAITLRTTRQGDAMKEAQANARLALMIAIGELQEATGPDTRVTASSRLANPSAPPIVGVWKSWEGLNHETGGASIGRPIRPDYSIKNVAADGSGSGRFITWLVSGPVSSVNQLNPTGLAFSEPQPNGATVPLLANGSVGAGQGQIHLIPQVLQDKTGAYAWWVSPENQKARLGQPHRPDGNDFAAWSDMQRSHSVPDPEPFGLSSLLDDPESYHLNQNDSKAGRKAISLASTGLITPNNPEKPEESFHDLSTTSFGLLTNTATGGWRKDLSIFSERWSNLPASGLPLFRLRSEAGANVLATKPNSTNPTAARSIFYPWSGYISATTTNPRDPFPSYYMEQHGAVASWHSLVDYVTSYKTIDFDSSTGMGTVPLTWARTHRITPWGPSGGNFTNQDLFNYLHNNQKSPVLARIQWVFKVRSRKQAPANPNSNYQIDLLVTPVYTLWNPHNVAIRIDEHYGVSMNKTMPVAIAFAKGSEFLDYTSPPAAVSNMFRRFTRGSIYDVEGNRQYDNQMPGNYTSDWEASNGQAAGFPIGFTLAPGEARQFSLASNTATGNTGVMGVLKDGYDGANAFGFASINNTGQVNSIRNNFLRTDTLKFGMRFDNVTRLGADVTKQGPGIYLNFGRWAGPSSPGSTSAGNNRYLGDGFANYTMLTNLDFSKAYWNEPVDLPTYPVLAIEDNGVNPPWTPVFSIIWGPRLSMGTAAGNPANRSTKGMVQNSPFASGVLTTSEKLATNHPANLPFDFMYLGHQLNSDTLPEEGATGFIVSGNQLGDGLSRLVLADIPMRPITSIMELQGWDLRARNPIPPFQYNIIGNSDANPMVPKNDVVMNRGADPVTNRQHDDSYCANHLLFDDWFVSSIAPDPQNFGRITAKSMEEVYKEFLTGTRTLPNRAYLPIPEDQELASNIADQRVNQIIRSTDGWQKAASRFQVAGMFNINSVSVKAWRALLGHARKQQVAYHTRNGIALDRTQYDHVVSRGAIASDVKAGPDRGMGGAFSGASEYTGFRTLTDAQLDLLAERIVEQVRARGPFLSLSEFMNRRLDSNEDLALAGAVQTALNSLASDLHPRLQDPDYASRTLSPNDAKMRGADYKFEKASEGYNTYGLPGWIRQADVLRPIAPILTARDDTFTIRTYGESRNAAGKVMARAWCEAVVTRTRDFVDKADAADSIEPPVSRANQQYGRRYVVTSFRWLTPSEV